MAAPREAEGTDERPARARVPELTLPPLLGGATAPLRAHRQGTVLVLLGETPAVDEERWLGAVNEALPTFAASSGRVAAIVPAASAELRARLAALMLRFPVLVAGVSVDPVRGVRVPAQLPNSGAAER